MRIWDISPSRLCRKHLLGEHRELHAIWSVICEKKKGYSHHPEIKRWVGKLSALQKRHSLLVAEMHKRGYNHHSPLPPAPPDLSDQTAFLDPPELQFLILQSKPCLCPLP